jgi:hypothetical protein
MQNFDVIAEMDRTQRHIALSLSSQRTAGATSSTQNKLFAGVQASPHTPCEATTFLTQQLHLILRTCSVLNKACMLVAMREKVVEAVEHSFSTAGILLQSGERQQTALAAHRAQVKTVKGGHTKRNMRPPQHIV